MPELVIKQVQGPKPWESQHGKFNGYVLTMEGLDKRVEINQKDGTPDPQVGQTLNLDLSPHPKFDDRLKGKKVQQFQGRGGGGPRPEDPKRAATILRQHSQEMALRYIVAYLASGGDATKLVEADGKLMTTVLKLADVFDKDAKAAGERAA